MHAYIRKLNKTYCKSCQASAAHGRDASAAPGGAEAAVHATRTWMARHFGPGKELVKLDFRNAFKTVPPSSLAHCWPLVRELLLQRTVVRDDSATLAASDRRRRSHVTAHGHAARDSACSATAAPNSSSSAVRRSWPPSSSAAAADGMGSRRSVLEKAQKRQSQRNEGASKGQGRMPLSSVALCGACPGTAPDLHEVLAVRAVVRERNDAQVVQVGHTKHRPARSTRLGQLPCNIPTCHFLIEGWPKKTSSRMVEVRGASSW